MPAPFGHTPTPPGHPLGKGFNYTLLAVFELPDGRNTKVPLAMYHSFEGIMADIDNGYAFCWAKNHKPDIAGARRTGYDYVSRNEE